MTCLESQSEIPYKIIVKRKSQRTFSSKSRETWLAQHRKIEVKGISDYSIVLPAHSSILLIKSANPSGDSYSTSIQDCKIRKTKEIILFLDVNNGEPIG